MDWQDFLNKIPIRQRVRTNPQQSAGTFSYNPMLPWDKGSIRMNYNPADFLKRGVAPMLNPDKKVINHELAHAFFTQRSRNNPSWGRGFYNDFKRLDPRAYTDLNRFAQQSPFYGNEIGAQEAFAYSLPRVNRDFGFDQRLQNYYR